MTTDYPIPNSPSDQLEDLHVYVLPRESWNEKYSSVFTNDSISDARSAGFVSISPNLTLYELRTELIRTLGGDIPASFAFLHSVGRCMTRVKPKQEQEMKCKAYLPPSAWQPEIFVLEDRSMPAYQAYPGSQPDYSPRLDATQPINGMPTHFPQVANHDRMAPVSDGQSPMVQQQQGYKGDPLQSTMGVPGKAGRPDAYTNNTNEDSGIAEPTPDDDDPDYQRRKSDIDDQYYNQLNSDQQHNRQFQQSESRWERSDSYEEKEIEKERQRIAEIQEREEERKEEERLERERREVDRQLEEERREEERRRDEERIEEQRQREEERREDERKQEHRRQEEMKKQRLREMEKQRQKEMEEQRKEEERMREEMERRKEAERQFEEERRRSITERERMEALNGSLDEDEDGYDDAAIAMETNQSLDSRGHVLDDEHIRRQAEHELRDYEPQSTWDEDGAGGGEVGHLPHPGRGSRRREDTEMEMASQQAVQDGIKRVHLTPEVHRKAKVGKIRKSSITDEEEVYETDPEMANLLEQLQIARQERLKKEKERENLIKRAKELQTKTHERRNRSLYESKPRTNSITPDLATHPRDYWKKRYFDEKRKTKDLERDVNDVRSQVDMMHNKLLSHLQGKKKGTTSVKGPPSKKNDHKINILKMQHELDEIRRKVDNSRMNLTREVKIRNQAEEEVRGLKSEVTQRKINMTLIRNQKLAALKTADNKLLAKTPIPALGQGPLSFSAKR